MTEASSNLLKSGKDSTECCSYHAISLLNCDVKILAKAIALRLENTVHSPLHLKPCHQLQGSIVWVENIECPST